MDQPARVWSEADEQELRERLLALKIEALDNQEEPVEWNPANEFELRALLRKVALEERASMNHTEAQVILEQRAGFPRKVPKDGSDMEGRIQLWETWLVQRLPEPLLSTFLRCAGLRLEEVTPPKRPRKTRTP